MKIKPMLGEFNLDGIEYIESGESRALVEHRVPGLEGNYFQDNFSKVYGSAKLKKHYWPSKPTNKTS